MLARTHRQSLTSLVAVVAFLALSGVPSAPARAATAQDQQLALAAAGAIKIVVRGQGWLRVGQPALVAAGLPASVDPATLQLFASGVEQALLVTGNGDAAFGADEAIEFYGVGRDTLWTDARTYWLVAGDAASTARVTVQTPAAGGAAPASFTHDETLVERKAYVSAILNGDATNFFGDAVGATPVTKMLTASHLDVASAGSAQLKVALQGGTLTGHQVDVTLNGVLLGTASLGPRESVTFSFSAPNVVEGANTVQLASHGAADTSLIESLTLSYPHAYAADGDALAFTAPAATRVSVAGFSTAGVRFIDVTDPTRPIELAATATGGAGAFTARVDTPPGTGTRSLIAFLTANVGQPAAVTADAPSSWSTPNHAGELLVISHASFVDALAPLVARRRQEGWSVQLVDAQDVYDERGGGDKTALAIRDFIQAARASWLVPPRFVLLVGDTSFDPRNFLGMGDFDFLPTKLIDATTMETASDDWFGDADLDGVPEVALGRMPVRTAAQATALVAKTLAWQGAADLPRGGLFVTDVNDADIDFETPSAAAEAKVSDLMPVDRFRRSDPANTSAALLAKLNAGPFLVNYLGHGSVELWDGLLTSAQASALTNDHASIYVVMNCLNGFFHDLYTTSLAESLLEAPGGAVAVWASSTLAEFSPQPAYNQEFLMHLGRTSLGETALDAKQATTDLEARRTWLLFGDPTLLGKPASPTMNDAGAGDGGSVDGGAPDGGGVEVAAADAGLPGTDASETADAGAPEAMADDAGGANDASPEVATMMDGAAAPDALAANDGGALDAGGGHDASTSDAGGKKAPASGGGCGCAFDASSSSRGAGGVLFLALACAATARRRRGERKPRRARRGLLGLFTLALAWLAFAPSAHAAYGFRKALTIDRTRIGASGGATTLSNYPLLIVMTDPVLKTAPTGHVQTGFDIAFTGADTTTCNGPSTCTFNSEIESYDGAGGTVIAWVNIPVLKTTANTANTVIYINYGDSSITTSQNSTSTWDTNFNGVWHLNQTSTSSMTESTSNANTGAGTALTSTTGQVGLGVSTDGSTSFMSLGSGSSLNVAAGADFTLSTWLQTSESYGGIISYRRNSTDVPDIDIMVGNDGATTNAGHLLALVRDDGGTLKDIDGGALSNAMHLVTVTRSGTTLTVYLDGAQVGTGTATSGAVTTDLRNLGREGYWTTYTPGGYSADAQFLAATFDELRASSTARNLDWITTDYKTQLTPSSTFTASGEALASCGNGTLDAGEACDDANVVSGDGCNGLCAVETGYTCSGTPSSCQTSCGDGILAGTEQCDDGNGASGDGCNVICQVESLWHCTTASPSVCVFAEFDYYKTITVNKANVGTATGATTLSNYPILFSVVDPSLASTAYTGGRVRDTANGNDIIFQGVDTTTCNGPKACQLIHEVETWDASTGTLVAWVRVPTLNTQTNAGASTQFRILFGNKAITTSPTTPSSVWDSSFVGVWHLNQTTTTTMTDSTSNANNGAGTALTSTTGQVSLGVSTDGSTSFMSLGSGSSLNVAAGAAFTFSTWLKTGESYGGILSFRKNSTDVPDIDIMMGNDGKTTSAPGHLLALARDDAGTINDIDGGALSNAWHLMTVTRSGSTLALYVDLAQAGTATVGTGSITTDLRNLGREGYWTVFPSGFSADAEFLAATFDELRASNTARSIEWITTDYNAQSSPGTFISYTTGSGGEVTTNTSTDVSLASFDADASCTGTTVSWETAYEIDTLGFNVYRVEGRSMNKVNASLIAGAGLTGGGAHRYELVDAAASAGAYELETVHLDLASTWDGPVTARGGCTDATTTPPAPVPAASVGLGDPARAGAAPLAAGETDRSSAAPEVGGCSLAATGAGGASTLALAAALLTLSRRRLRRR